MHSLIVPIQLFLTSQRDIPFQRVLRGGRIRGKTVELAIRWGEEKKKGEKRIAACKLSLLVSLSSGGKSQEKYSAWKIKARGGRMFLSLFISQGNGGFSFFHDGGRTAGGVKFIRGFNGIRFHSGHENYRN